MDKVLDPVILSLTQNRLDHISHQMGWVMVRTARSPIFSQAHDFSCFIAGPDGQLVIALAHGIQAFHKAAFIPDDARGGFVRKFSLSDHITAPNF